MCSTYLPRNVSQFYSQCQNLLGHVIVRLANLWSGDSQG